MKLSYVFWIVSLSVLLALILPYLYQIGSIIFFPNNVSILRQLEIYKWLGVGIAIYSILHHFSKKNIIWFETFSHEMTHIIVALFFGKRIHSFRADEGSGAIFTSGHKRMDDLPISLAPYCLPIFTYLLLSLRCLLNDNMVWVYDIILGASICFHFFCFKNQTGNYQTDINQYPLILSYLYILTALIINICIILVAFFPQYNVYTSAWRLIKAVYSNFIYLL